MCRQKRKGRKVLDIVKRSVVGFSHGGKGVANYDFAKWKKFKEAVDEETFKVGLSYVWNCPKSKKEYSRGYFEALDWVCRTIDEIDEEYEGYKRESAKRRGK